MGQASTLNLGKYTVYKLRHGGIIVHGGKSRILLALPAYTPNKFYMSFNAGEMSFYHVSSSLFHLR
jgi:hypothetical protein